MIHNEDFMGLHLEAEELRECFTKFFLACMSSAGAKFEAKGEGTAIAYNGIACYATIRAQPSRFGRGRDRESDTQRLSPAPVSAVHSVA